MRRVDVQPQARETVMVKTKADEEPPSRRHRVVQKARGLPLAADIPIHPAAESASRAAAGLHHC
jgi:hypothetical protein